MTSLLKALLQNTQNDIWQYCSHITDFNCRKETESSIDQLTKGTVTEDTEQYMTVTLQISAVGRRQRNLDDQLTKDTVT